MNALLKCQQYIDTIGFQKTFGSFIPSAYPDPESTYFFVKERSVRLNKKFCFENIFHA